MIYIPLVAYPPEGVTREKKRKRMHSTHGLAMAQLRMPAINGVDVGLFPRETGGKVFGFKRNTRRHTLRRGEYDEGDMVKGTI